MAKLERGEGIDNLDEILLEVDGVMVARGDLGVEIPMERVPLVQKEIVRKANEAAKSSCIATQMLRSMVESPTPTRAEVSGYQQRGAGRLRFNSLVRRNCGGGLPGGGGASGRPGHPGGGKDLPLLQGLPLPGPHPGHGRRGQPAGAGTALQAHRGNQHRGGRPTRVSRYRPEGDIIVFAHEEETLRRLCLGWGLQPSGVIPPEQDIARLVAMLIWGALSTGLVTESDVVTIIHGSLTGVSGTTNTIQVLDVGEYLSRYAELVKAATGGS